MAQPGAITIPTQSFTAADMLALVNYRIGAILAGAQTYGENGRNITHVVYRDLCDQREKLMAEVVDASADSGGGNVLVRLGQAQ